MSEKGNAELADTGESKKGEVIMKLTENQITQLNSAIEAALSEVYEKDIYLIKKKVHERTIVSRFCIYFQKKLVSMDFTDQNGQYKYGMGYSIVFSQERTSLQKILVKNGEVCHE